MLRIYIFIYLKRNILLALVCAIPLSGIIIDYFINGAYKNNIFVHFTYFIIIALGQLYGLLLIIPFKKMIKRQEILYDAKFSDSGEKLIEWPTLYLNDDWLICACTCALYKKYIKKITHKRVRRSYRVVIKTNDNKQYVIWCGTTTVVNKIKKWLKN